MPVTIFIPHAFKVRYCDANDNYIVHEVIVFDKGRNMHNSTLYETLDFTSTCSRRQHAVDLGKLAFAARRHTEREG